MANIVPVVLSTKGMLPIVKVEAVQVFDVTDGTPGVAAIIPTLAWEKATDDSGPIVRITDMAGLIPGRKYKISFLLTA